MRILTVSHYFDTHRGGIEIVAARLCEALSRRGHRLSWAATDATGPSGTSVSTCVLPAWNLVERWLGLPLPLLKPAGFFALRRAVRDADMVLVHDGLYTTSIAAVILARIARRPVLVVQHIGVVPYRNLLLKAAMLLADRLIVRPMLAGANQAVFISEAVKDHFAGIGFQRAPAVIFNGIAPGFVPPAPGERDAAREQLGVDDRRVALFVGRFVEKKGLNHLRAVAALRPETLFLFAGWGVIDPRSWGLPNVQVIEGLMGTALTRLYHAADMLVLPSVGEGLPLVIQEALACGLPVICSEAAAAGDPELRSWVSTVAVTDDPADTGACLAEAIRRQPMMDSADIAARSRFARERYDWSEAAKRYLGLITTLVEPAPTVQLGLTEKAA